MIGKLTGRLEESFEGGCILDVNGVGYVLACSRKTLDVLSAGSGAQKVLVETHLRQDALTLYGFATAEEREAFRSLIEVKTVGPQRRCWSSPASRPGNWRRRSPPRNASGWPR